MVYSSICKLTGDARLVSLQPKWTFQLQLGIGEGRGSPPQSSCLENPLDRRAWWATVHGVTKSQTRLANTWYRSFLRGFKTWKWASSCVFLLHSDSRQPSGGPSPPCDIRMMQGEGQVRDVCLQLSSAVMGGCKPRTEPHSSQKMNPVSANLIYSQNSVPTAYCKLPEYKCGAGRHKVVCRF